MANPEHLAILHDGVRAWNRWRTDHPSIQPDLSNANLQDMRLDSAMLNGAVLVRAYLEGAELNQASLRGANLSDANLSGANLIRADLTDARLVTADFRDTNLRNANLSGATLRGSSSYKAYFKGATLMSADLSDADFQHANFSYVEAGWTTFANNDLSVVLELETVQHRGPSTVGIDTIYRSRGKIPESFLRGCGVPDQFIKDARSLVDKPIQFFSCFISYSTKDQDFADRLCADLQANGVRCWFAPHDVKGGRKLYEQIEEAIRIYDRLLLILSDASMNSEWVKTEIANARQREIQEKRQMLFPITVVPFEQIQQWKAFDVDTGKDSAREIREYFIPDFSTWKDHDSYRVVFERLLQDLHP